MFCVLFVIVWCLRFMCLRACFRLCVMVCRGIDMVIGWITEGFLDIWPL